MGDQAYCLGGADYPSYSNGNSMYDLSDNAWTAKINMTYSGVGGSFYWGAGAKNNGYAFGNFSEGSNKCEKYDIAGNSWSAKASQPWESGGGSSPLLLDYIWGNRLKYNPTDDIWCGGAGIGANYSPLFQVGGYIYAVEGTVWAQKLDPSSMALSSITALPANNFSCAGFGDGTYGYQCGGSYSAYSGGSGDMQSSTYRYDPSGNSWATRASMGTTTAAAGSFVIEGSGHSIAGGCTDAPRVNRDYNGRYDNTGNNWTSKQVYPRSGRCASGFYVPENFPPNAPTGLSVSDT